MKAYIFKTNKKNYFLKIIYCSIDIKDIENYLKRIESIEKSLELETNLIVIPNYKIYSLEQLKWAIFIAKNRFLDKISISKNLWNETILTLCATDQINKISEKWYLQNGINKDSFLIILSRNEISLKEINDIKNKLEVIENKTNEIKFNTKETLKLHGITEPNAEDKIIEKMS